MVFAAACGSSISLRYVCRIEAFTESAQGVQFRDFVHDVFYCRLHANELTVCFSDTNIPVSESLSLLD